MKNTCRTNLTQADIQDYVLFQFDALSSTLSKFDFETLVPFIKLTKQEFKRQSELRKQIPCTVINLPADEYDECVNN